MTKTFTVFEGSNREVTWVLGVCEYELRADSLCVEGMPVIMGLDELQMLHSGLSLLFAGPPAERAAPIRRSRPALAGQKWSQDADVRLTDAFKRGDAIRSMADGFGRTPGAIHARLVHLGLVEATGDERIRA